MINTTLILLQFVIESTVSNIILYICITPLCTEEPTVLLVNSSGSILKNSRHDKKDKRGVATAIVVIASWQKKKMNVYNIPGGWENDGRSTVERYYNIIYYKFCFRHDENNSLHVGGKYSYIVIESWFPVNFTLFNESLICTVNAHYRWSFWFWILIWLSTPQSATCVHETENNPF